MQRLALLFAGSLVTACGDGSGDTTPDATTTTTTTTTVPAGTTTTADAPTTTSGDASSTTGTPEPATTSTTSEPDPATTTSADDSTTTETTATTGEPLACPPGFFCEDFEGHVEGMVPGAPWQPDIGEGSALVETGMAVSGTHAVHLKTGNAYGGRALLGLAVPEQFPTTHQFGRLRMWLSQASPDGVHWTMISADGTTQGAGVWNDQPFASTIRYGGQHEQRLMANYDTPGFYSDSGPGSDCWHHSQQKIPEQTWACMEWEFDSDNRQMRFWLDGQPVDDLTVGAMGQGCIHHDTMDQWYYPTIERMSFGWVDYQDGGSRELWLDDIAVGPSRVGCD